MSQSAPLGTSISDKTVMDGATHPPGTLWPRVSLRLFLLLSVLATVVIAIIGLTAEAPRPILVSEPDPQGAWAQEVVASEGDSATVRSEHLNALFSFPTIPTLIAVLFLLATTAMCIKRFHRQ